MRAGNLYQQVAHAVRGGGVQAGADRRGAAGGDGVHGVADQVLEHMVQPPLVPAHQRQVGRQVHGQRDLGGCGGHVHLAQAGRDQPRHVHQVVGQVEPARLQPRHVEDGVKRGQQAPARLVHRAGRVHHGACLPGLHVPDATPPGRQIQPARGGAGRHAADFSGLRDHLQQRHAEFLAHGGQEVGLAGVRRVRHRPPGLHRSLRFADRGDIGVGGDEAAVRRRVAADLQHTATLRQPLLHARQGAVAGQQPPRLRLRLRADAQVAAVQRAPHDFRQGAARHDQPGRRVDRLGRHGVVGNDPAKPVPQDDAVADVGQHRVHQPRPAPQLVLRGGQGGDVGDDAQVAAIGQRRGPHLDPGAVRALALAVLHVGRVEGHLLADDRRRVARAVLAGVCAAADHLLHRVADHDGGAVHDAVVVRVHHRQPPVGAIDRDAVRDVLDDAVQDARPAPGLVLRPGQGGHVEHRHRPAAVGQRVGLHVDHLARRPLPAECGGLAAVERQLAGQEQVALEPRVLVAGLHPLQQVGEGQARVQAGGGQAQQLREALVVELHAAVRPEHRDADPQRRQRRLHARHRQLRLVAHVDHGGRVDQADHVRAGVERDVVRLERAAVRVAAADAARGQQVEAQRLRHLRLHVAGAEHAAVGDHADIVRQGRPGPEGVGRHPQHRAVGPVG